MVVTNGKIHTTANGDEYTIQSVEFTVSIITVQDDEPNNAELVEELEDIDIEIAEEDEITERKFALLYERKFALEKSFWDEI